MTQTPKTYIVTDGEMVLELVAAEEGGYAVRSPFIKGLNTEAATLEEAFEMARDAAAELAAARESLTASSHVETK